MTLPKENEDITALKKRCHSGDENFSLGPNTHCIFSATAAKEFSQKNYQDLTLPDRLIDILRRRSSSVVSWQEIRSGWIDVLKNQNTAPALKELYERMSHFWEVASLEAETDFSDLIQWMTVGSLLPSLVNDLSGEERQLIEADQKNKLSFLLAEKTSVSARQRWLMAWRSMRAASVFRRAIKRRSKEEQRPDLLQTVVQLLPRLGMDRAVDAMVTVHTAVNGPPGAALGCLAFELSRRPEWMVRIREQLDGVSIDDFCQSPMTVSSDLMAFVREVLRMWNVPVVFRNARKALDVAGQQMSLDASVIMSPYFIHRNPQYWPDPDIFKPERWLERQQLVSGTYVPFGWAPKHCVGAQLGTVQMLLLGYLLTKDFSIEVDERSRPHIVMTALPTPMDFKGKVVPRTESQ
ncbi:MULTISPECIES: cytochrome P450 [Gammaproteobacteria]|uniref:Cytochrome P450 n=1 Tax=Gallaecimonas pentaromativorans TaxID=584787 RepID=A0A3N1PPG7_9GAMM|nr:cytochrome P450 [Gallaecimonas pentaromativorans]ROQ28730.1 cytochrome P450 [Gallaecimonas pentaromativorans]